MKFRIVFSMLAALLVSSAAFCVEISLDSSAFTANKQKSAKIAYVDIEKVFNEHPMTKRLKTEFQDEVLKRKNDIDGLDLQIRQLQQVVASTTTEIMILKENMKRMQEKPLPDTFQNTESTQTAQTVIQSTTIAEPQPQVQVSEIEARIREKETNIEITKAEIAKLTDKKNLTSKQAKDELPVLEEKHTATVLADIYELLQKIAADNDLTAILDKNNVLYGPPDQDITPKVLEMIQGR